MGMTPRASPSLRALTRAWWACRRLCFVRTHQTTYGSERPLDMSYQKLRDIEQNGNVLDQAKQNRIRARQKSVESFPDSYIRETLAAIDGVRHGIQRLDGVAFHPFPARMPLTI